MRKLRIVPCAEGISLTTTGVIVMMVGNFAFSINKVRSEVQIPGLGVDDDARRAQLTFQMSA